MLLQLLVVFLLFLLSVGCFFWKHRNFIEASSEVFFCGSLAVFFGCWLFFAGSAFFRLRDCCSLAAPELLRSDRASKAVALDSLPDLIFYRDSKVVALDSPSE